VSALHTLAALSVIPLGLLLGLVVWLATRNRRLAVDRTLCFWGDWGTRAAGIEIELSGGEHLERPRPAVFVLNHQSGVDPMIACALLRHHFTAVAKIEIRRNPWLGPAFAFAGVVFVDRADPAQALRSLAPAVEVLTGGLSLAVAPEGTRRGDTTVGPFKKGAFRIAMAARAPIVPICIHNSLDVLPPGGWIMRPGRVRVTVLPPISTADWELEHLDAEIKYVHQRFRDVLSRPDCSSSRHR
jgi:putative phosphoserine phosphatase/1-acylglycerol-3-phosphate O-acyltransferase